MRRQALDRLQVRPVHQKASQPGFLRSFNVRSRIISHIDGFGWLYFQHIACCMKDFPVGLGEAEPVRRNRNVKMMGNAYFLQINHLSNLEQMGVIACISRNFCTTKAIT